MQIDIDFSDPVFIDDMKFVDFKKILSTILRERKIKLHVGKFARLSSDKFREFKMSRIDVKVRVYKF